jgi:hypothetical protein
MATTETSIRIYLLKILSSTLSGSNAPIAITCEMLRQFEEKLEVEHQGSSSEIQTLNDVWMVGAMLLRILCIYEESPPSLDRPIWSLFKTKFLQFDSYHSISLIVKGFEVVSPIVLWYQDLSTFERQWKDIWKRLSSGSGDTALERRKWIEATALALLGDQKGSITISIVEYMFSTSSRSKDPDILISMGDTLSIAFAGWYSENLIRFADLHTIMHQRSKMKEEHWRSVLFLSHLQNMIQSLMSQSSTRLAAALWLFTVTTNCKNHSIIQVCCLRKTIIVSLGERERERERERKKERKKEREIDL